MACDCIDEMNAKLATLNTELALTFGFSRTSGESYTIPTIETKKIESKKRVGPALAIATFCPFCGTPYSPPLSIVERIEATGVVPS